MRTLRDEWRRMTDAMWQHLYTNQFFRKYGDYRVVEGELVWAGVYRGEQMERLRDRVCVEVPDESGSHYVHIGRIGDNVKLILPPEEKDAYSLEEQYKFYREESDKQEARADRYEKALRENVKRGEAYGFCPVNEYQCGAKAVAHAVAAEAREALDDSA